MQLTEEAAKYQILDIQSYLLTEQQYTKSYGY